MNRVRPRIGGTLAAVLAACLLAAGGASAQTPFAMQNLGQRIVPDDARMVARGFGMTVTDSLHPGFKNVASLAALHHVALKFTAYGENSDHQDLAGRRRETHNAYVPDIRVGVPLRKGRLALTAGLSVFRAEHFQTRVDTTWQAFGETIIGNHQFVREGSLYSVPLGAAWQPVGGISVSATLNLVHGAVRDAAADFFRLPAIGLQPFYQPNSVVSEDEFNGTSATFGALLAPGRRLRLAAGWTPAYNLDVVNGTVLQGVAARTRSSYSLAMPAEYRLGAEMRLFGRWRVGGDAFYASYTELAGRADWESAMEDEYSWTAGVERIQARERRGGAGNLPLRLSAGYRRWAYAIGGQPVDERIWAGGTGFPFRGDMGQLDLALSYSRIGGLQENGHESTVWRLTVSVTGLERWW